MTYGNWKRHLDTPGAMAAIDKNTKNDEEIKIDWSVSDWSKCSHTCGKNGTQIRKVECVAIKGDKEQTIPKQICNDAGFKVIISAAYLFCIMHPTILSWVRYPKEKLFISIVNKELCNEHKKLSIKS